MTMRCATHFEYINRVVAGTLVAFMVTATLVSFPTRASAQGMPVIDPSNLVQNMFQAVWDSRSDIRTYVLNPLMSALVDTIIDSIKKSTINWARNGFEGKPSFVTDLKRNLRDLKDAVTEKFFYELEAQGKVKSPFLTQVAIQVRENYYRGTQENALAKLTLYTLDGVCAEHETFLAGDFAACGVEGWIHSWRNPWNNPLGAQISAENELARNLASVVVGRVQELEFGSGFLSKRECTPRECAGDDYACHDEQRKQEESGRDVSLSTAEEGYDCKIVTPGAVIHGQLETVLGADIANLVSADEINEVLGIIAANLVSGTLDNLLNGDDNNGGPSSTANQIPPTVSSSFLTAVEQQVRGMDSYQSNWTKIRGIAAQAQTRLKECGSRAKDEDIATIDAILAEADASLTKGAGAVSDLTEFRARVVSARNQAEFQGLADEYQTLLASDTIPSATEFARASQESINIPAGQGEETLFAKAVRIAGTACSIFNGNDGG